MKLLDKIDKYIENRELNETTDLEPIITGPDFNDKKYSAGMSRRVDTFKPGEIFYITYKNGGLLRKDIFQFSGFSSSKKKYGESDPVFKTWQDVQKYYNIKTFSDAEKLKKEHGYNIYMCGLTDSIKEGCYYYIFKNNWSRGSGADRLTFYTAVEVK